MSTTEMLIDYSRIASRTQCVTLHPQTKLEIDSVAEPSTVQNNLPEHYGCRETFERWTDWELEDVLQSLGQ